MKKEELVAMVGQGNIGGWWTSERIAAIVLWGITIIMGYLTFVLSAPLASPIGLFIIVAVILSAVSLMGRKVFLTTLRVKKITDRQHVKVRGNDGKTYEIKFTETVFNDFEKNEVSYVKIDGRSNDPQIILVIGSNINEIWEK